MPPFILISPATRGLSLALARHYLRTTSLPVFGTYRPHPPSGRARTPETVHEHILRPLSESGQDIDPSRLHVLPLDLTSEESIASAADTLARTLSDLSDTSSYIRTAFFLGGVLHPERQPADLVLDNLLETFGINVTSHLLMIKHFSRFLPPAVSPCVSPGSPSSSARPRVAGDKRNADFSAEMTTTVTSSSAREIEDGANALAKWVHVSARVGSISDNKVGGWYSYRASKAALNQVIRTFDLHLQTKRLPAMCIGVHPGTVKTDLSKAFWPGVKPGKLFEPWYAALKLAEVVQALGTSQRGRVWDWKGEEVKP